MASEGGGAVGAVEGIVYVKREQFRDFRYEPPRDAQGRKPFHQAVKLDVAHFTVRSLPRPSPSQK